MLYKVLNPITCERMIDPMQANVNGLTAQCEQLSRQMISQTNQSTQMYQQMAQLEEQNARELERLAQRERQTAQTIQQLIHHHETTIQQLNQIQSLCQQIENTGVSPQFSQQIGQASFGQSAYVQPQISPSSSSYIQPQAGQQPQAWQSSFVQQQGGLSRNSQSSNTNLPYFGHSSFAQPSAYSQSAASQTGYGQSSFSPSSAGQSAIGSTSFQQPMSSAIGTFGITS